MRGCLQVLTVLVAGIFVAAAVVALFVVNLAQVVTDREAVKEALALESLVREVGPTVLAEQIRDSARQQGLPVDEVNTAVLQQAANELIPPGWVDSVADSAVDGVYNFLETGDVSQAQAVLDMGPLLAQLRGVAGQRAVLAVLQSLPACTEEDLALDLESGTIEIPACIPPFVSVPDLAVEIHTALVATLDANPQLLASNETVPIPLFDQMAQTAEGRQQLQRLYRGYLLAKWAWLLWFIPAGCLLLILLLAVRSLSQWGHWWGWPLLATGVLALLLALLVPSLVSAYVESVVVLPPQLGVLGRSADQLLARAVDTLLDAWLADVYIQGGIMLAAGVLLIVIGFFSNMARRRPTPSQSW